MQVCVLGLPWEYSARDVRALLEGAGHVERVEVLYRNDGKSEVRRDTCCNLDLWASQLLSHAGSVSAASSSSALLPACRASAV